MSPEQLAGKKVDGRSDLYSLGVMLFQMLTGVLPFRGESMAELMYKIANEDAPDVRVIRSDLPESLANLVSLAVSKRPETRYQDGDQFAADLRSVMGGVGEAAGASTSTGATMGGTQGVAPGHEKTAVFAATVPGSADFEKTVVHNTAAASRPPADKDDKFEKTSVHQAGSVARPANQSADTYQKTVVHQTLSLIHISEPTRPY